MKIRLADEKDLVTLAEFNWLHEIEDNETDLTNVDKQQYFSDFIKFMENQNGYKIFVAEIDGKIASVMFVYIVPKVLMPSSKSKSIAYLTKVFTLKEHRNKKIGTRLLIHIKDYLTREQCELIFVWPSEKSVGFYKRNGFVLDKEIMQCTLNQE
ncbi:MAG: GNAT family N-acetyltransferase [Clostridia bacterium]|nr:GNAT family N-acetyltransferase [Clostridia bacterium]